MQNPPAGAVVKKLGLAQALQLMYCCYGKQLEEVVDGTIKIIGQQKSIAEHIQEILVQRYGLLSIADEYLYGNVPRAAI
jgi:hypothetical protein